MPRRPVCGAETKEQAVEMFWESLNTANGTRRQKPEEFVTINKVTRTDAGWVVYYSVPSRIVRDILRPEVV